MLRESVSAAWELNPRPASIASLTPYCSATSNEKLLLEMGNSAESEYRRVNLTQQFRIRWHIHNASRAGRAFCSFYPTNDSAVLSL